MIRSQQLSLCSLFLAVLVTDASAHSLQAPIPSADQTAGAQEPGLPRSVTPSDWSFIRTSIEASRHAFEATHVGFEARNARFDWLAQFDGTSASIQPAAGDWSFGLAFTAFGFDGSMQEFERPEFGTCAEGQKIVYGWSAGLSEWWVNDQRGFEHGFTVHERPTRPAAADASPLTFDLDVLGDLQPNVNEAGTGLSLLSSTGSSVLRYDGLVAFDANGVGLAAWLEVDGRNVRICVDESNAIYPVTVDPVVQEAYVKASNTGADDLFGLSVAASGDTVIVGAPFEDSDATGIDGDQLNEAAPNSGAAYVFVRSGATWIQEAYLKASNTDPDDVFGWSVAVSGNTVVVGAWGEGSVAPGVDGDQSDNSRYTAGAAYVFVRSGSSWAQEAYLKASRPGLRDEFGSAVAVSGDTIVVGARGEDSDADSINGNEVSNAAQNAGAAYVFVRSGSTWAQEAYLKAPNSDQGDRFGISVAAFGDTVVAGASGERSTAAGVDGNLSSNAAPGAGAAYVFARSGSTWSQSAYLKASNTGAGDQFGRSVTISGDTIAVGAFEEDSNAVGIDGDQSNNDGWNSGAAYVFVRSGSSWSQEAYLKASHVGILNAFGESIAVSGDTVIVGARREKSTATGINGSYSPNANWEDSGAAYAFARAGSTWTQTAYLKASNAGPRDEFGSAVAASGNLLVVGASRERSRATGVGGDQSNNNFDNAGAAYFFSVPGGVGTSYCASAANSTGAASCLAGAGSASVASNSLTLVATGLPASVFGHFIVSTTQGFTMTPGGSSGNLCLGGSIGRYVGPGQIQQSDAAGTFSLLVDLTNTPQPNGSVSVNFGETWNFQAWHRDVNAAGATSNLTNGIQVTFTI